MIERAGRSEVCPAPQITRPHHAKRVFPGGLSAIGVEIPLSFLTMGRLLAACTAEMAASVGQDLPAPEFLARA